MTKLEMVQLPKEVLEKAEQLHNVFDVFKAIEGLVGDDFSADCEWDLAFRSKGLTEREKVLMEKIGKIYMLVHAFNPGHSCYSVHENWRQELKPLLDAPEL